MPRIDTRYYCETCHEQHWSYDEARQCENGHILDVAIEKTRKAIKEAFTRSESSTSSSVRDTK